MFSCFLLIGLLSFTDCTPQSVPAQQGSGDTAPTITTQGRIHQVDLGVRLEINCTATGSPTPTLHWTRRKLTSTFQSVVKTTQSTNNGLQLVISRISSEDEGPYYCLAVNRAGAARMVSYVDVRPSSSPKPPILTPLQNQLTILVDEAAIFLMAMKNTPVGTAVYWELPEYFTLKNRVGKKQFFYQDKQGRAYLFIKDVFMRDRGTYRCRVVTPWGLTATQEVILFPDIGMQFLMQPTSYKNLTCSHSNPTTSKTPSFRDTFDDSAVLRT